MRHIFGYAVARHDQKYSYGLSADQACDISPVESIPHFQVPSAA